MGVRVWLYSILTSALDGGEWTQSCRGSFPPRNKRTLVPIVEEVGGEGQSRFERFGKEKIFCFCMDTIPGIISPYFSHFITPPSIVLIMKEKDTVVFTWQITKSPTYLLAIKKRPLKSIISEIRPFWSRPMQHTSCSLKTNFNVFLPSLSRSPRFWYSFHASYKNFSSVSV